METVRITIDGKEIEAVKDTCVLDVARDNGIEIPGLCYNPEVKDSGGSCRICIVEAHQDGKVRIVTPCNYPAREGLEIKTDTERIMKLRKGVIELLLARVPDSDVMKALAAEYGIEEPRFFKDEGEFYRDKCISCSLCTKVCADVVGVSAIAMLNRGADKAPGTPYSKDSDACIGCGACAFACPTDAIVMTDDGDVRKIWGQEFKMVKCSVCGKPYIPEKQVDWIVEKTGQDRSFFDKCPDHR